MTRSPSETGATEVSRGALASNYNPLSTTQTSVSVNPANLSATGTQVYNGTTGFSGSNLKVDGVDGQTFSASGTGTLGNSGNVQTNQNLASVSGLTLSGISGALASNYNPLSTTQTLVSVTPALLTLSTTASKSYDGTPSLSLTASDTTFSGRVTGTLNSSGIGKDLDGTISLSIGDLTGENGFRASNYLLPTIFLGGAITSAGLPTHEPVYSLYYAPGTSVEGVFGEVVRRGIDWQPGNMQTIPIQSSGRDLSPFPGIGYILHIVGTGVNMEGLNEDVWVLLDGNQIGR